MSLVPEKTSTRPSGLILIQACDGSPFWFMPVGYSIAEIPRPVCLAMSVTSVQLLLRGEVLGEQLARAGVAGHRPVVPGELVADRVGDREDRRHGGRVGVGDPVRRRVAD